MTKFTTQDFIGLQMNDKDIFVELLNQYYGEPHRHYHNVDHIKKCLELQRMLSNNSIALTVAILFHDIIYDLNSPSGQNEKLSAEFAVEHGPKFFGAPTATDWWSKIYDIIMATTHTGEDIDVKLAPAVAMDAKYMINIDLYTLGSYDYERINANVKAEYLHVYTEEQWNNGRLRFLDSMLKRERIFYELNNPTANVLFDKLDKQARSNMIVEKSNISIAMGRK